eukprot:scaffold3_cov108-Isochrysis_galbana.AAC.11
MNHGPSPARVSPLPMPAPKPGKGPRPPLLNHERETHPPSVKKRGERKRSQRRTRPPAPKPKEENAPKPGKDRRTRQHKQDVGGDVVLGVVLPDLRVGERPQIAQLASRLRRVSRPRVQERQHSPVHEAALGVLAALHLAVHHALVLAQAVDVVHLGGEGRVGQARVQDVVRVDREQVQRALVPGGGQRVARVVGRGPRIGTVSQGAVGQLVEDALERVQLRPEEDGVLQRVRQPVVLVAPRIGVGLGRNHHVHVGERLARRDEHAAQPGLR